jgi:hypothetical protein
VQEIDISTGKVLFQWNSADHVPYRDSHNPLPGSATLRWDWFHINAVHLDTDGNLLISSRVVTVKLDLAAKVATLVKSVRQPEGLVAGAEGNAQTTCNGDLFVGWGALPYISEFSPSGQLLFNAELPAGLTSYRAYRLPWHPAG